MRTFKSGKYTINYVARSEWDQIGRTRGEYTGPKGYHALVPHHTVTGYVEAYYELVIQKMRWLQTLRPDLGNDVPYNWVTFADPDPYACWVGEGRGLGWSGAHTYGYNYEVHANAFWGNSITDPVSEGVLEGMRFTGRLMVDAGCPMDWPTKDHGSYPNQGTQCAGTKLRAALPVLQPPFTTPGGGSQPATRKAVPEDMRFELRTTQKFTDNGKVYVPWRDQGNFVRPEFIADVVCYDCAIIDPKDEITITLKHPESGPRRVVIMESNGAKREDQVSWGIPVSYVVNNGGGTVVFVGADAVEYNIDGTAQHELVRVEAR